MRSKISRKMILRAGIAIAAALAVTVVAIVVMQPKGKIMADAPMREQASIDTSAIPDEPVPLVGSVDPAYAAAAQSAMALCNQQRAAAGLSALTWNDSLMACAAVRAQEASVSWSHTRPDGSQWYTVNPAIQGGENLAMGYQSAQDAVNAWMASPTHRENVLYPSFRYVGIAIYNVNGSWYWAEEFGY